MTVFSSFSVILHSSFLIKHSVSLVDYSKLYRPSALNSFQFIALTGLLMSAGAHLILHFFVSQPLPAGFNWLYVCWVGFYVIGTLINLFGKPDEPHHHH